MNLKTILTGAGLCFAVWAASVIFFACFTIWRSDLDVIAGANAMTMMFVFCAGTAVAVEAADKRNL